MLEAKASPGEAEGVLWLVGTRPSDPRPFPNGYGAAPLCLFDMLHWLMYIRRSSVRARRGTLRALLNKDGK